LEHLLSTGGTDAEESFCFVSAGRVEAAVFAMDYEDQEYGNATTPIYSIGSDFLTQWLVLTL
jgi:hypothetical protein